MKRLWIAALLLAVLFGATLCNNLYLRGFTGALNALLEQAEQLNRAVERARRGDATVRAPWAEEGRTALSGRTGQRSGGWLERGEDSAAAVDRAFQRDSRRYDQGFALY